MHAQDTVQSVKRSMEKEEHLLSILKHPGQAGPKTSSQSFRQRRKMIFPERLLVAGKCFAPQKSRFTIYAGAKNAEA